MNATDTVRRVEYLAVLAMLYRRRTWLDRWRARRVPGHWVNIARRELMVAGKLNLNGRLVDPR